jgi:hypothetical protein
LNGCGTATTNAATAAGNNILHFSNINTFSQFGICGAINTTNPVSGGVTSFGASFVWNLSNLATIPNPAQTTATYSQSTNSTSITMNANATGAGVANGDLIRSGSGPYQETITCGTTSKNMLTGGNLTLASC